MDKATTTAREHIASLADLIGAVRLPEGTMRATAGTEVVIDVLVFQRRAQGQATSGAQWMNLRELVLEDSETWGEEGGEDLPADDLPDEHGSAPRRHERKAVIAINEYFADHPEMVLGTHGQRRGIYGPGFSYTCRPIADGPSIETQLDTALSRLPAAILPAALPAATTTPTTSRRRSAPAPPPTAPPSRKAPS